MPPLVSIVLSNFNYEQYVSVAIESALAQDHPHIEVIVVDDGSTDRSWDSIARYDGRVRTLRKSNGGQASTLNAGFRVSRGEIVLFLDSDDFLMPTAASSVVSAWADGCAKVQFRLAIVDQQGVRTGATLPPADVVLPSGDLVPMIAAAGGYVCPVTSGNAYGRAVLEQLMPIPEAEFRAAADGYLNAVTPFYGKVISLQDELGAYRMHGANLWMGQSGVAHLRRLIEHDWLKERYALATAQRLGRRMPGDLALRDWRHVFCRLSHLRLDPDGHPVAADTRLGLARAGMSAVRHAHELAGGERLFHGSIMLAIAIAPAPLARRLVRWANTAKPRPAWLRFARRAARAVTLHTRRSVAAPRR
jgi:hypothetical protein